MRFGVGVAVLFAFTAPAPTAEPPAKAAAPAASADDAHRGDDYRQFFKKPETTEEYWLALQYEIEVGRLDLASGLLHALLAKPPTEDELLALEDKYGMAAFLTLHTIPKWSDDPNIEAQARKDASQLIDLVRAAVKKKLSDPVQIKLFVKNLSGEPDEHDFALKELYRRGAQVVPYIIDELQTGPPEERPQLLDALRRLGPETLPPLYAVLDSNNPNLQLDILDILRKRGAVDAVPFLWRLTGPNQPEDVRRKATRILADFLGVDESDLLPAKLALTREAERYYQHKVLFADPNAVTIWRWDDAAKHPVRGWPGAETVNKDKAEEYYGTRFAKEALALDPSYAPAQNVLLSLALEKGAVQAGPPPGRETPAVRDLLSTVNPELITAVLGRALDDRRPSVILPAVEALGEMDDVRAGRPGDHGESALERALIYPDRRVQMAAADAILRISGEPAPQTAGRMVEVWRRALAADPPLYPPPEGGIKGGSNGPQGDRRLLRRGVRQPRSRRGAEGGLRSHPGAHGPRRASPAQPGRRRGSGADRRGVARPRPAVAAGPAAGRHPLWPRAGGADRLERARGRAAPLRRTGAQRVRVAVRAGPERQRIEAVPPGPARRSRAGAVRGGIERIRREGRSLFGRNSERRTARLRRAADGRNGVHRPALRRP